jgi:hypothetical protein
MHEPFELIDRTRRALAERGLACVIAGGATDEAIAAAEDALACRFPPSYRSFLSRIGSLTLPQRASTIQQFVGLGGDESKSVVTRTQHAWLENRLGRTLVIVGLGAEPGEWFCLDVDRPDAAGECPVMLFDARDNQLDQQFYDDFGSMLCEVLRFVLETLAEAAEPELAAGTTDERALGGVF